MAEFSNDIYIGLGSNLDRPDLQIKKALARLKNSKEIKLLDHSSLYLTAPTGYANQPYFLNAVAKLKTQYNSRVLLKFLQSIENRQYRRRTDNQNAPRTLDLDILLYGNSVWITDNLIIPHPRMLERRFVLDPLLEIAPGVIVPGYGMAAHYLSEVSDQDCQRIGQLLP